MAIFVGTLGGVLGCFLFILIWFRVGLQLRVFVRRRHLSTTGLLGPVCFVFFSFCSHQFSAIVAKVRHLSLAKLCFWGKVFGHLTFRGDEGLLYTMLRGNGHLHRLLYRYWFRYLLLPWPDFRVRHAFPLSPFCGVPNGYYVRVS